MIQSLVQCQMYPKPAQKNSENTLYALFTGKIPYEPKTETVKI